MGIFHVLNCTKGTISRKASQYYFHNIDFNKGLQLNQIQVPKVLTCHCTSVYAVINVLIAEATSSASVNPICDILAISKSFHIFGQLLPSAQFHVPIKLSNASSKWYTCFPSALWTFGSFPDSSDLYICHSSQYPPHSFLSQPRCIPFIGKLSRNSSHIKTDKGPEQKQSTIFCKSTQGC